MNNIKTFRGKEGSGIKKKEYAIIINETTQGTVVQLFYVISTRDIVLRAISLEEDTTASVNIETDLFDKTVKIPLV